MFNYVMFVCMCVWGGCMGREKDREKYISEWKFIKYIDLPSKLNKKIKLYMFVEELIHTQ